jgi:hypothetical protein
MKTLKLILRLLILPITIMMAFIMLWFSVSIGCLALIAAIFSFLSNSEEYEHEDFIFSFVIMIAPLIGLYNFTIKGDIP